MKRQLMLAVAALVVLVSTAAADSSRVQQDPQRPAQPAPVAAASLSTGQVCAITDGNGSIVLRTCVGAFCERDTDCASCPGGLSAWFCNSLHKCQPF